MDSTLILAVLSTFVLVSGQGLQYNPSVQSSASTFKLEDGSSNSSFLTTTPGKSPLPVRRLGLRRKTVPIAGKSVTDTEKIPRSSTFPPFRRPTTTDEPCGGKEVEPKAKEVSAEEYASTVDKFLDSNPTKTEIVEAFYRMGPLKLGPQPSIPLQQCGPHSSAKVYSMEESKAVFHLQEDPKAEDLDLALREYNHFVIEHHSTSKSIAEEMKKREHKSLKVVVLDWNAFLLAPNVFELLTIFLSARGFDVNTADLFIIHLQENSKWEQASKAKITHQIQQVLNVLSTTPDWGLPVIHYLNNAIGTKAKTALKPNTQTVIYVHRTSVTINNACLGMEAVKFREKGYIGIALEIEGHGTLASMGMHMPGWKPRFFLDLLSSFVAQCGKPGKGMDSFDLGLMVSGDWNEHADFKTLEALEPKILGRPEQYPAMQRLEKTMPTSEPYQRMVDRLTLALSSTFAEVLKTYNPLLWATERLGRGGTVGGGDGTLPSHLREHGFSLISACHGAGWTYKWKPRCAQPALTKLHKKTPFAFIKDCLAPKVYTSVKGVGFLDRLALRLPSSSQSIVDTMTQRHEQISSSTQMPKVFAIFRTGAHVYNNRSDHIQAASLIELIKNP